MSNVQTSAERAPHDMSHFVYTAGAIGRLKVVSFENLNAGDSIEMNTVGSFRLSPLKRGLALDTCLELFTFYVPYRHCYDLSSPNDGATGPWVQFMKDGVDGNPLPVVAYTAEESTTSFLGTRPNNTKTVPVWLWQGYRNIYNNYFKLPYAEDMPNDFDVLTDEQRSHGMECNHLKTFWSAPLNPNFQGGKQFSADDNSIDIVGLNAAYGQLHTEQERTLFMTRYRDVIESFGGKTTIDADSRPRLLMRSKFWASGYDVDGTDQSSLGQFSGRVQQTINHRMPRWYCPEHGVVITVALVRFPPVVNGEISYLMADPGPMYSDFVGDPAIAGNSKPTGLDLADIIPGAPSNQFMVPHSQWFRYHHSHVDEMYSDVGDFPFVDPDNMDDEDGFMRVNASGYDKVFQSTQLKHWNMQLKFNDTVYRNLPSARDAAMTD